MPSEPKAVRTNPPPEGAIAKSAPVGEAERVSDWKVK